MPRPDYDAVATFAVSTIRCVLTSSSQDHIGGPQHGHRLQHGPTNAELLVCAAEQDCVNDDLYKLDSFIPPHHAGVFTSLETDIQGRLRHLRRIDLPESHLYQWMCLTDLINARTCDDAPCDEGTKETHQDDKTQGSAKAKNIKPTKRTKKPKSVVPQGVPWRLLVNSAASV
eukprot:GHVS01035871.1.p1 GENE.GHVS01035871.1~~GHVS01035871.1.p1  ORF type:complete len:172 (-),score=5.53 GHVS01035871.1:298-813(-)